jgi:hypothetical protein
MPMHAGSSWCVFILSLLHLLLLDMVSSFFSLGIAMSLYACLHSTMKSSVLNHAETFLRSFGCDYAGDIYALSDAERV